MAKATRTTVNGKAITSKKAAPAVVEDKMYEVRSASIVAGVTAGMANEAYVTAMNRRFGRQWIEFDAMKASEIGDNLAPTIIAYKAEKAAFYEGLRSKHKAMGKKGDANPSVNWANFKKIVRDMGKVKGPGSGKKLPAMEAAKRSLPALYRKFNDALEYDTNDKAQGIAHHIGNALRLILTDDEWTTLNQDIG